MPSSARASPRIQRTTDSRAAASAWGKSIDGVEQPEDGQAVSRYRLLLAAAGALRRSNQPVVLGRLLSRRVLIGNKTGFFLEREVNERWRNFSRSVSAAAAILSRPSRRRI
jgi:hypothetical protein